jgi:hypothetical protein
MEGGFGFVMTANSVGDNHFAREQTAALKRADEQKREMEAAALSDFEASKARAASEALEKDRETEAKAAKSFVWGAASLKVKRAPGPVHIEPAEAPDPKAKRQKAAPQASNSDGEDGAEARGDGEPAATDNATSGTLAGLGDYSSSSSDSDDWWLNRKHWWAFIGSLPQRSKQCFAPHRSPYIAYPQRASRIVRSLTGLCLIFSPRTSALVVVVLLLLHRLDQRRDCISAKLITAQPQLL